MLDNLDQLSFQDSRQQETAASRLERVRKSLERWKALVQNGLPERGDGVFEGTSELDVVLESPEVLVLVASKYTSDIEMRSPWDPQRDEIARCLDGALELAGSGRQPYFLLVTDDYVHESLETSAMAYEALLPKYRSDTAFRSARLPHRTPAELARLEGRIGWMSWADLVDTVLDHSADFTPQQKGLLRALVEYLKGKKLLHKGG